MLRRALTALPAIASAEAPEARLSIGCVHSVLKLIEKAFRLQPNLRAGSAARCVLENVGAVRQRALQLEQAGIRAAAAARCVLMHVDTVDGAAPAETLTLADLSAVESTVRAAWDELCPAVKELWHALRVLWDTISSKLRDLCTELADGMSRLQAWLNENGLLARAVPAVVAGSTAGMLFSTWTGLSVALSVFTGADTTSTTSTTAISDIGTDTTTTTTNTNTTTPSEGIEQA